MKNLLRKYKVDIKKLEELTGKSIHQKLIKERDEINFISKISEIKIGTYLAEKFQKNIEYEPKIDKKTPDWLVSLNGEKIIIEVLKINLPNEELTNKIELYKNGDYTTPPSEVFMGLATLKFNDKKKIESKEITYRKLIEDKGYKLIIGIDASDWEKRIDVSDIKATFNFNTSNSENNQFIKNVTGLLVIPYMGNIEFILNNNSKFKINPEILNKFKSSC